MHFIDNNEYACDNYDKNNNDNTEYKNNSNKIGRKVLYGGTSEKIFFIFTCALQAFADQIKYLLSCKKFAYVLIEKINNNLIKLHFSLN